MEGESNGGGEKRKEDSLSLFSLLLPSRRAALADAAERLRSDAEGNHGNRGSAAASGRFLPNLDRDLVFDLVSCELFWP